MHNTRSKAHIRFQVSVSGCVFMFSSHARQISSGARSSSTARAGAQPASAALATQLLQGPAVNRHLTRSEQVSAGAQPASMALAMQLLLGLAVDMQVTRSEQVSAANGAGPTRQRGRQLQRRADQL